MPIALGPMSLGEILDRGLRLTLRRLGIFFAVSLIFLAPLQAASYGMQLAIFRMQASGPTPDLSMLVPVLGSMLGVLLLAFVLVPMGQAASLAIVAREFLGEPIGLGDAMGFALRRFLPLLAANLMVGLVVGLGFVACCVPAFLFMCWFAVVAPVVVVEHAGPVEAMQRSLALTEGRRWHALAIFVLLFALQLVISVAVGIAEFVGSGMEIGKPIPPSILITVVQFFAGALVQTYFNVVWSLYYFDLRIRKEGFDLTLLSQGQAG